MPTSAQRLCGALASIGITVGGAWLASTAHSDTDKTALSSLSNGLILSFENIRNDNGNIVVMVFDDREAFKSYDVTRAVGYREVPAVRGTMVVKFPDLTSGPFAVAAFHDEDKNQDLNMNGDQPDEGYATSGATDAYDTPTFRSATIVEARTSITMFYADQ